MEHFSNCRHFQQSAAQVRLRLSVRLGVRRGSVHLGGRRWPSELDPHLTPGAFGLCQAPSGKLSAVFAALLLAVSGTAQAGTINARSPSFADVSTAVASAHDGDTVIVPGGTASWTRTLVINKAIRLLG